MKPGWWLACLAGALALTVWTGVRRAQRVVQVSDLAAWSIDAPVRDPASPTGYSLGRRRLIAPAHANDSYEWLAQAQEIRAAGALRLRQTMSENAPYGRPVHSPSPYRWWLAGLAAADSSLSGDPAGIAVERVALYADPLLFGLFLLGTTLFARWQFGGAAAGATALGFVALFPFAGGFLPGAPGPRGLQSLLALWSVLPLLAGVHAAGRNASPSAVRRWFVLGGVNGAVFLWTGVGDAVPVLAGIALGAAASSLARWRRSTAKDPLPPVEAVHWRAWSLAGALATLAAFLVEYFPANLGDLELRAIHPVYGLAWLGLGELLVFLDASSPGRSGAGTGRRLPLALGLVALAALPAAMAWADNRGFLATSLGSLRLTNLADGVDAANVLAWLSRDGFGAMAWATLLPSVLLTAGVCHLWRRDADGTARHLLPLAAVPALVALVLAGFQLRWWQTAGGVLLALLLATTHLLASAASAGVRRSWFAGGFLLMLPGLWCLRPPPSGPEPLKLTDTETRTLFERDLAWWLAHRSAPGGATVIAPPELTASLLYHGSLRGVGTLAWENEPGMAAAVRILSATSPDESQALIEQRRITHLIIPSWDTTLDAYAGTSAGVRAGTFLAALKDWAPPPWVRPVAFPVPDNELFAGLSVLVFEIVEPQAESLELGRIAEYFVDAGHAGLSLAAARELARFPADIGALVARAYVAGAQQDAAEFNKATTALLALLDRRADRYLEWDRRVSLTAVLLQARHRDRAITQMQRCLAEADEARLRFLSPAALTRFLVVARMLDLKLEDPRLQSLALSLVPPAARARL